MVKLIGEELEDVNRELRKLSPRQRKFVLKLARKRLKRMVSEKLKAEREKNNG